MAKWRLAAGGTRTICSHADSISLMDSDRKSTVSSFYGRPRTSTDALNSDFPPPNSYSKPPSRLPDEASSFYDPQRPSRAGLPPGAAATASAGYNRNSFFYAGREEPLKGGYDELDAAADLEGRTPPAHDQPWDVYADFNNAGPRYSTAFGIGGADG